MGIKDYLAFLPKKTITNISEYDVILLDSNFILHSKIYKCKNDDDLYNETQKYCKNIFKNINKLKEVYVIFDGENEHKNDPKEETHQKRDKKVIDTNTYSGQLISHDSPVMIYFQNILVQIIENIKNIGMLEFKIITSFSNIKGEGDMKINSAIQLTNALHKNICVVTKDTDLVQLAFINSIKRSCDIDVMVDVASNSLSIIPSNEVRIMKMPAGLANEYNFDYIFIIALMGNDYLPKIGMVDFNCLCEAYYKFKNIGKQNILTKTGIHIKNLHLFITCIIIIKKIKFKSSIVEIRRFNVYFNNLQWFLKYYGVIDNDLEFIKYDDSKHFTSVLNIYNLFL